MTTDEMILKEIPSQMVLNLSIRKTSTQGTHSLELLQIQMQFETIQQYHGMFVLIYFWKIRKVELTLQHPHFFFVVKQRPLFD